MRRFPFVLLVISAVSAHAADGMDRALFENDERALALLAKPTLDYRSSGTADAPFERMSAVLGSPTLLTDVQREYERILPEGEKPEFVITEKARGLYHYVNQKGEESEIREVVRDEGIDAVQVVLHATGSRFFGRFEALIQIRVTPRETSGVDYDANILAHPESRMMRWIARFPLVDRYFQRKTREVTGLAVKIGEALCAAEPSRVAIAR